MTDGYSPIKGKCTWWRERPSEDDVWNPRIREEDRRVSCSCFVEGDVWTYTTVELPADCPKAMKCRYHIRHC